MIQLVLKSEYDDRYLSDLELRQKVENSLRIEDVDFTQYDVIFLAGGWGAAYDRPDFDRDPCFGLLINKTARGERGVIKMGGEIYPAHGDI